jgi:S1-C subfamily serine protease
MRRLIVILFFAMALFPGLRAQTSRFVIDDDDYLDRVTAASSKLLRKHKLVSLDSLRAQVHTKGSAVKLAQLSQQKFSPPDLCERLRESTLAVGSYYKCPDCGEWHFNSSAGFVVAEGGIVCTCCHVVLGEDEGVKESYLIAADSAGNVFPVKSVVAADTDADTCFLKVDAPDLKPLPMRSNARAGERVYCLSHPGGYHFMFTEGMVARLNRRRDEALDLHGRSNTNGILTRPILYLNVTAEFAPGSSGAPIVDENGNVVGQVSSIADAGEPDSGDENNAPSPSVPVRFCVASEEIAALTDPQHHQQPIVSAEPRPIPAHAIHVGSTNRPPKKPSTK